MEQRVSLVTLGVSDLAVARGFYERLGWSSGSEAGADIAFFQAGAMIVALWDRARLAEDSGVTDAGGWGGVTLAHNVHSAAEVDAVLEQALAAGATIARPGAETFWGGYSGVFVDPDGHPWEVAHNPFWTLTDDGSVRLDLAASTSASVTSTIASRSATAIRSSGVWMSVIPFARFTHARPRALKTLASAPPPESA